MGLSFRSGTDEQLSIPEDCTLEETTESWKLAIPTDTVVDSKCMHAHFNISKVDGGLTMRLSHMQEDVDLEKLAIATSIPKLPTSH